MKLHINFSSVGFSKIFKRPENISESVIDKEAILTISKYLSDAISPRSPAVEFKSLPELVGIDYVGYVIEKERFDPKNQEWIKTDEYKLVGSKSNIFRDTRVAYGYTYRYRMKSVLKITIKKNVENLTNFQSQQSLQAFVTDKIKEKLAQNTTLLAQLKAQENSGISFKTSSGIANNTLKLSDTVSAVLNVDNTFKLVDSVSKQVLDFSQGTPVSDEQFLKILNQGIDQKKTVENDVECISFYYESRPSKNWSVVDVVKLTPPEYPQAIKIFPNSTKKEIVVCWLKPVSDVAIDLGAGNWSNDPRFYSVYRRTKVGEPWTPIAEGLKEFETLFVDKNVVLGQKYIYAISSIDIHGIESFLSTQIQAELNANIATERKEKDLVWVSGGGASLDETGLIVKKFYERKEQLIAIKNITLKPSTRFREESKVFLIKVKSLDTHEQFELRVTLKNQKLEVS